MMCTQGVMTSGNLAGGSTAPNVHPHVQNFPKSAVALKKRTKTPTGGR